MARTPNTPAYTQVGIPTREFHDALSIFVVFEVQKLPMQNLTPSIGGSNDAEGGKKARKQAGTRCR